MNKPETDPYLPSNRLAVCISRAGENGRLLARQQETSLRLVPRTGQAVLG